MAVAFLGVQRGLLRFRQAFARGTRLRVFCLIALAVGAASALVCWLFPAVQPAWRYEAYLIEDLQALLFGIAFLLGLFHAARAWGAGREVLHLGIVVLSLLACLDEISWGARLFGVQPIVAMGYSFDGLHDLIDFAKRLKTGELKPTTGRLVFIISMGFATMAATAAAVLWAWRRQVRSGKNVFDEPAVHFLLTSLICFGIGAFLDLHLFGLYGFVPVFIEEQLELTAAASMVMAVVEVTAPAPIAASRTASGAPATLARASRADSW